MSTPQEQPVAIESFDSILNFERRMHRIGNISIPYPGGVPTKVLIGGGVCAAITFFVLIPLLGPIFDALNAPLVLKLGFYLGFTIGVPLSLVYRIGEGRTVAQDILAWLRHALTRHQRNQYGHITNHKHPLHTTHHVSFFTSHHHHPLTHQALIKGPARITSTRPMRVENGTLTHHTDGSTRIRLEAGTSIRIAGNRA